MTSEEAAIVSAYTGILIGDFNTLHKYIEKKLDRPVWTHEMASLDVAEEIKKAAKADFVAICVGEAAK